ncbi:restriction endonuclease subunit S [Cellulomonas sp. S1-8]|uniref:restriction endonuclease subunit S n=1 Tax=Cellulomonas sp. S1-8 TaxID=2904790 RepID=UPI002242DC1D|nr:restriction endonuclease subunit S [Cellulomonas sp. S1-8]UZN05411.1 restriction endonuclease subunit S [Cellulomonas sp. S1-8]
MNFSPAEQAIFSLCDGDVLVTEGSGSRDAVGASAVWQSQVRGVVCFQNTLLRMRPRPSIADGRFIAWWARHAHASGQMAAVANGANILHLGSDGLRRLQIDVPPIDEQRRIADFLDDQVSRIDRVIEARRRQLHLVRESRRSELEALLGAAGEGRTLATLTDPARPIQYGIVLPGPDFPGGVPIIKGGDIGAQRLHPELLRRTAPEIDRAYSRSRVREGDVVIAIRGSVGEVATVPDTLAGANLTQDSARIAPQGVCGTWLLHVLQTPTVQARIARMIVGATVKGINIADLRRVIVPTPNLDEQAQLAKAAQSIDARGLSAATSLESSAGLLNEYKQALITAAVTGHFDVPTASGRSLPA